MTDDGGGGGDGGDDDNDDDLWTCIGSGPGYLVHLN